MIPEKRQDISSLSPSFFTHLYLTHLPWRIPLSEVPHASLALFCTFDISSFLRIVSICLCPLWPPNLLTHPSSWKQDNLFFLFKYFYLVLKSHHESQLHSYYTPFLLPSISGFHFNPSDASVCHVPWSPMKSTLISSCALPLHHHPPTSVTLSARTLKFFLSPLWEVILSLHASWSHCFCLSGASLPVTSCLQLSSTWVLPHWHLTRCISCPSAFFSFLTASRCFTCAVYRCLSHSLGLPAAVMHHGELRAVSACWHLSAPQQLHTPPPRPGCSHSTWWWENCLSWGKN